MTRTTFRAATVRERRPNLRSGVTLIEILIAVSLLSLLSVGVLIAMRIGFNTMDKVDNRMVSNRRVSYARRIIENEIAGYTFVMAQWRPSGQDTLRPVPFSQWEPQSMRFVTSYSLQDSWRGRPQLLALQVIPGADGNGVRLIADETPYTGPVQAGLAILAIDLDATVHYAAITPGSHSFVLADRLAYCRFTYLEPLAAPPFQIWRPDWVHNQRIPQGIRIEMAPLDVSPINLHVSTITTPLHVNLNPGESYDDSE